MWLPGNPQLDAASAISIGKRDYQEDAVISDCPVGGDVGLIVLSDGMGGHAAGDVASKIVMTEVFSELKLQSGTLPEERGAIANLLRNAATGANDCLRAYVEEYPASAGMGATLVAAMVHRQRLHWISIGDSVLFLFRNGSLRQLNEDHSFGAEIDRMVDEGQIPREVAEDHPDRNCLTSVVSGAEIARVDCPEGGVSLYEGDIVVVASDGLQFLEAEEIEATIARSQAGSSTEIAACLLDEIERLCDPDQDNVSIVVLKVNHVKAAPARIPYGQRPAHQDRPECVGDVRTVQPARVVPGGVALAPPPNGSKFRVGGQVR